MKPCPKPTVGMFREFFYIDRGVLRLGKVYGDGKKPLHADVGYSNHNGYLRMNFLGSQYYVHRVIYFMSHGYWPVQVDHINGDRSDNRVENLRGVTRGENCRSFNTPRNNTSSVYRGVSWNKEKSRWFVRVVYEKIAYRLGYFACEKEAALAYNYKAQELGYNPEAFNQVFEEFKNV